MSESTRPEIVMYARERFCPDVTRARTRLTDLEIPWIEYDIESDQDALNRMVGITGRKSVPTLLIGDHVLIEPSVTEIDAALTAAGYDVAALSEAASAE